MFARLLFFTPSIYYFITGSNNRGIWVVGEKYVIYIFKIVNQYAIYVYILLNKTNTFPVFSES